MQNNYWFSQQGQPVRSTSTTFSFVTVPLRGAWKQVLHTPLSLLSLLPLGSLAMDLEDRYKVDVFEEQVMKDQNRFWKHIKMQNSCKCEMYIGNTHFFNRWVKRLHNHVYWLSETCKVYAKGNGIQKSESCTLLAHCCICNSLNPSSFVVFILRGKCLLQSLELSKDSSLKTVFQFFYIARHEKPDPALNNAELLVINQVLQSL